jgi:hypothetical protein
MGSPGPNSEWQELEGALFTPKAFLEIYHSRTVRSCPVDETQVVQLGVSSSKEKEPGNPRLISAALRAAGYIKVSEFGIKCLCIPSTINTPPF